MEPQSTLEELDMLLQVLKGTGFMSFKAIQAAEDNQVYTSRSPEEIVTDYLGKVFRCASRELNLRKLQVANIPVDIVLTVPVVFLTLTHL